MKIGEFCSMNNVTIDTIRHYIDMGLIVPMKKGRLYDFDGSCQKDLEEIITLKSIRFSLSEIKSYFNLKRLGSSSTNDNGEHMLSHLSAKQFEISREMESLRNTQSKLTKLVENIDQSEKKRVKIGTSIDFAKHLFCPTCSSAYEISNRLDYENGMIKSADLLCDCDNSLTIENGIVIGSTQFENRYSEIELHTVDAYKKYISNANAEFIKALYFAIRWIVNGLNQKSAYKTPPPRIMAEFGVGSGFFLRTFMHSLCKDDTYIAIDHDLERLKDLKNHLETMDVKGRVIFICCDIDRVPIKNQFIDIAIDFFGSLSVAIESEIGLIERIDKYMRNESEYYGVHTIASRQSLRQMPVANHQAFSEMALTKLFHDLGYTMTNTYLSDFVEDHHVTSKNFLIAARKHR